MKKFKEEQGSMAVYVTVVLLGFLIILSAIYMSSTSVRKAQLETNIKVKESYEYNYGDIDEIYETQLNKLNAEKYGTSILTLYNTLYQGKTTGTEVTKVISDDEYYNGNYSYPRSLANIIDEAEGTKILNVQDNTEENYKKTYILAGNQTYNLDVNSDTNSWVRVAIHGGNDTSGAVISEFNLGFSDGTFMTLDAAVNSKYIEPLVICASSAASTEYMFTDLTNIPSGGSSGIGNYAQLHVFFKVNNLPLSSVRFTSNNAYSTDRDGLEVYQASPELDLALIPW